MAIPLAYNEALLKDLITPAIIGYCDTRTHHGQNPSRKLNDPDTIFYGSFLDGVIQDILDSSWSMALQDSKNGFHYKYWFDADNKVSAVLVSEERWNLKERKVVVEHRPVRLVYVSAGTSWAYLYRANLDYEDLNAREEPWRNTSNVDALCNGRFFVKELMTAHEEYYRVLHPKTHDFPKKHLTLRFKVPPQSKKLK